jgi:hypothetical protein
MRHASEPKHRVPTICRLPEIGASQLSQIEVIRTQNRFRTCDADRQHCRQRFWSPEDGLPIKGFLRISGEKKAPIAAETDRS